MTKTTILSESSKNTSVLGFGSGGERVDFGTPKGLLSFPRIHLKDAGLRNAGAFRVPALGPEL